MDYIENIGLYGYIKYIDLYALYEYIKDINLYKEKPGRYLAFLYADTAMLLLSLLFNSISLVLIASRALLANSVTTVLYS